MLADELRGSTDLILNIGVNHSTLASGIDVGQGINIGSGKFVKKNKRRALNKRMA